MKIEEVMETEGFYLGPPVGVSMWPMLRNRTDVMLVRPAKDRLDVLDVALYHRGDQYVLHRVVGYYEKGYVICGDNCVALERVPYGDVFGVLEGFYRDDRYIECSSSSVYKAYSKAWVQAFPVRKACKLAMGKAKGAVKLVLTRSGILKGRE